MIICPNRDFFFLSEKKLKPRYPCSQIAFFLSIKEKQTFFADNNQTIS